MLKSFKGWVASALTVGLLGGTAFAQSITIGSASNVSPGDVVTLPANLNTGAANVAGVNLRLAYDDTDIVHALDGNDNAMAIYNGHSLLQNVPSEGDYRSVIVNTASTANFSGNGAVQNLIVSTRSTLPNGTVINLTPQDPSAIADENGNVLAGLAGFTGGSITIVTPYPDVSSFLSATDWSPVPEPGAGEPFLFNPTTTPSPAGSGMPVVNSGGIRTNGFWISPEMPLYSSDNLFIASFNVTSNRPDPEPRSFTRFRTAGVGGKASTFAYLSEYQVSIAQPPFDGTLDGNASIPASHIVPTNAGRTYRFPFAMQPTSASVEDGKHLAWDQITFFDGVATDFTYFMENEEILRYDMNQVLSVMTAPVTVTDYTIFSNPTTPIPSANLFPLDTNTPDPDDRTVEEFRLPAGTSIDTGAGTLTFTYDGNNDLIHSFIETNTFNGETVISRFDGITLSADTLYMVEFDTTSTFANAATSTAARYRINVWETGESWLVTSNTIGTSHATPSTGNDVTVRMFFIPSPEADGRRMGLAYDAWNFLFLDPDNTASGSASVTDIRIRSTALSNLIPIEPIP